MKETTKMVERQWKTWGKRLMVVPPIVLAIGAYWWLVKHTPPLQMHSEEEVARMLETIVVPRLDVDPKVSGLGVAKYARSWRAVTQVEGRVNAIHPELRPGSMIQAGEILLEIDASDYRSRVAELTATMDQQNAEVERLEQSIQNDQENLVLENEVLAILQRELDRQETLLARQAVSSSSIDEKRREWLNQQKTVQNLKNNTALLGPQIKALQAGLRQLSVQKEQAERDIARTKITAPFAMRMGEVQLEVDQFVGVGETIFMGYSDAEVEIEAQLALQDIHRLLVSQTDGVPPKPEFDQQDFQRAFSFDALVKVAGMDSLVTYPAKFLRVREIVDAQTKMVGFVVGVQNVLPHDQSVPTPPLLEGAFCDVEVFGKTLVNQVVIPRNAIRGGSVYLVDDQNRLTRKTIELEFTQDTFAVVASGLDGGERLVIANPSPAIVGMLVQPIEAGEAMANLVAAANSGEDVPRSDAKTK